MLRRYLRQRCNRDKEIAALDEQIASTGKLADPVEKMVRYHELAKEAKRLHEKLEDKEAASLAGSYIGGFGLIFGVTALGAPILAPVGLGLTWSAMYASTQVAKDARDALQKRRRACAAAETEIADSLTARELAHSPLRTNALAICPSLSKKFAEAIAAIDAESSPPTPPKRPRGLNL